LADPPPVAKSGPMVAGYACKRNSPTMLPQVFHLALFNCVQRAAPHRWYSLTYQNASTRKTFCRIAEEEIGAQDLHRNGDPEARRSVKR
jgi:hypothetical protein